MRPGVGSLVLQGSRLQLGSKAAHVKGDMLSKPVGALPPDCMFTQAHTN